MWLWTRKAEFFWSEYLSGRHLWADSKFGFCLHFPANSVSDRIAYFPVAESPPRQPRADSKFCSWPNALLLTPVTESDGSERTANFVPGRFFFAHFSALTCCLTVDCCGFPPIFMALQNEKGMTMASQLLKCFNSFGGEVCHGERHCLRTCAVCIVIHRRRKRAVKPSSGDGLGCHGLQRGQRVRRGRLKSSTTKKRMSLIPKSKFSQPFNPCTPKFKKYILPTFQRENAQVM